MTSLENDIVILSPGDIYFGTSPKIVKTLLGSCIALTVWHEGLQIGGMCHYLIAEKKTKAPTNAEHYRYGDHALNYLHQKMSSFSAPHEFELQLFGGSNMYNKKLESTIGEQNVDFALKWLKTHNLQLSHQDILGQTSRKIMFDLSTGNVDVTHHQL